MNSKVLAKNLLDYRINVAKGGLFDPEGVGDFMQKEAVKSDIPLVNFLGSLKGKACFEIYSYWCFRDQVQEYQKQNNISSVLFKEINWDDFVLRYPEKEDQLLEMPQDKKILARYKNKVVDFFLKFSQNKLLKNYELFRVEYLEKYEEYIPQNIEDIKKAALNFEYAELYKESTHPVYEYGSNFKKIAYWSRCFTLLLFSGNLDDPCESVRFELYQKWDHEPTISEI